MAGLVDYRTFQILRGTREWMEANLHRRLTLADIASYAGFSPFHFQRLFARAFGESPQEFLTRQRLERAQRRLREGDLVTDICFDLGYESLGSFSGLFSREIGLPPSEFRRVFAYPGLWEIKTVPACFRPHFR